MSATTNRRRYGSALRIYDNGGRTLDRYTIVPPRDAGPAYRERAPGLWSAIGASESPFHGIGQHTSAAPGSHLGRRIRWDALPDDVQAFAAQAFPAFAFDLDTIAQHMCIAAVWADCEEGTHPRITAAALKTARAYAEAFVSEFPGLTLAAMRADGYGSHPDAGSAAAAFGHDLYLTARGHGVGFWCRDELENTDPEDTGDSLGEKLSRPLRDDFRKWSIEAEFYRGWLYLSAPITRAGGAA